MGRKAIAGVIAAAILFAMIFSIGVAYLLFVNSTNLLYGKALVGRSTSFQDVLYERLLVNTLLANNHVAFYVNNTGGVNANITDVYVLGPSGSVLRCDGRGLQSPCANSTPSLPIVVNLGKGSPTIDTGYLYVSGIYTVEVITERGSIFSATYPPTANALAARALSSGAIGDIYIQPQSYTYYSIVSCGSNYCLQKQGKAFTIPASFATGTPMAFSVTVTDFNPQQANITLDKYSFTSHFWAVGSSFRLAEWFIITNTSSTISSTYTPITLFYNKPVTLVFASGTPGNFMSQTLSGATQPSSGTVAAVFIVSHGWEGISYSKIGTTSANYGQNSPYVSTLYY